MSEQTEFHTVFFSLDSVIRGTSQTGAVSARCILKEAALSDSISSSLPFPQALISEQNKRSCPAWRENTGVSRFSLKCKLEKLMQTRSVLESKAQGACVEVPVTFHVRVSGGFLEEVACRAQPFLPGCWRSC